MGGMAVWPAKGVKVMLRKVESRCGRIPAALDRVEIWSMRAAQVMLVVLALASMVLPGATAHADGGTPPDEAAANLLGIFTTLAKLFIKVMYGLIMLAFAVGSVKAGLGAQASTAFGLAGRVSAEMMNLIGGVVIFAVAVMALPLANMVIDTVAKSLFGGGFAVEIHNPFAP